MYIVDFIRCNDGRWTTEKYVVTSNKVPLSSLGSSSLPPQSWLESQVKMILLISFVSLLLGVQEVVPVGDASSLFAPVLGITLFPHGFVYGTRYVRTDAWTRLKEGRRKQVSSYWSNDQHHYLWDN